MAKEAPEADRLRPVKPDGVLFGRSMEELYGFARGLRSVGGEA